MRVIREQSEEHAGAGGLTPTETAFFHRLLGLRPESVLDVGCGRGWLLTACRAHNVESTGVDRDKSNVDSVRRILGSAAATQAFAEKLPYKDSSIDWVVLRNVLHHIPRADHAVREGLRVSRPGGGVLIAEPWNDLALPGHRLATDIDRWSKRTHQALGYYHRGGLAPAEIVTMTPLELVTVIDVDYFASTEQRSAASLFADAEPYVTRLAADDPLRGELAILRQRTEVEPCAFMGSATVILRKGG